MLDIDYNLLDFVLSFVLYYFLKDNASTLSISVLFMLIWQSFVN
jgi:hypothetical protein